MHTLKNHELVVDLEVNPTPNHRIQTPMTPYAPTIVLKFQLQLQTNHVIAAVDAP
jgi:hypothetical protein